MESNKNDVRSRNAERVDRFVAKTPVLPPIRKISSVLIAERQSAKRTPQYFMRRLNSRLSLTRPSLLNPVNQVDNPAAAPVAAIAAAAVVVATTPQSDGLAAFRNLGAGEITVSSGIHAPSRRPILPGIHCDRNHPVPRAPSAPPPRICKMHARFARRHPRMLKYGSRRISAPPESSSDSDSTEERNLWLEREQLSRLAAKQCNYQASWDVKPKLTQSVCPSPNEHPDADDMVADLAAKLENRLAKLPDNGRSLADNLLGGREGNAHRWNLNRIPMWKDDENVSPREEERSPSCRRDVLQVSRHRQAVAADVGREAARERHHLTTNIKHNLQAMGVQRQELKELRHRMNRVLTVANNISMDAMASSSFLHESDMPSLDADVVETTQSGSSPCSPQLMRSFSLSPSSQRCRSFCDMT